MLSFLFLSEVLNHIFVLNEMESWGFDFSLTLPLCSLPPNLMNYVLFKLWCTYVSNPSTPSVPGHLLKSNWSICYGIFLFCSDSLKPQELPQHWGPETWNGCPWFRSCFCCVFLSYFKCPARNSFRKPIVLVEPCLGTPAFPAGYPPQNLSGEEEPSYPGW